MIENECELIYKYIYIYTYIHTFWFRETWNCDWGQRSSQRWNSIAALSLEKFTCTYVITIVIDICYVETACLSCHQKVIWERKFIYLFDFTFTELFVDPVFNVCANLWPLIAVKMCWLNLFERSFKIDEIRLKKYWRIDCAQSCCLGQAEMICLGCWKHCYILFHGYNKEYIDAMNEWLELIRW